MKELKRLKDRRAPKTLLPRVMAAVAAQPPLPWYKRAFWSWPAAAQAAYALGVAALAALIGRGALQAAAPAQALLAQGQSLAQAAVTVVAALWRLGGEPLRVVTLAMGLSCAAFAAGMARLLEPRHATIPRRLS